MNPEDVKQDKGKQELDLLNMDEVAGGAQVEVNNVVIDNKKPVKIGSTVVINM